MQSILLAPQVFGGLNNSINRGIRSTPYVSLYDYGINADLWEEGAKNGSVNSSKESDHLYMYCGDNNSTYIGFESVDLIDISSFIYLNVLWSVKNGDAPYKCYVTADKDKGVQYREDEYKEEGARRTDFTLHHDKVDIRTAIGEWCCKVSIEGANFDGEGISKLNVHKIWLD